MVAWTILIAGALVKPCMILLYEKHLLHLKINCPDEQWQKIPEDQKAAIGKDIVSRAEELEKKIGEVCKPVIDAFFDDMSKSSYGHMFWRKTP